MIRAGAVLVLVLAISWTVYLVAAVGLGVAVVAAIAAIALSIHVLLTGNEVTRYVENYDNTPHEAPEPR